jgi:hypothetical protein
LVIRIASIFTRNPYFGRCDTQCGYVSIILRIPHQVVIDPGHVEPAAKHELLLLLIDVDDLLNGEADVDIERFVVVGHGPFKCVVCLEELVEKAFLVIAGCGVEKKKKINYVSFTLF